MKEAREILGIPQRAIADMLGVVTPMISYYERETTQLDADRIPLIADMLCLTLDEIHRGVPPERELLRRYYTRLLEDLEESPPHTPDPEPPHTPSGGGVMVPPRRSSPPRTAFGQLLAVSLAG